MVGSDGFRRNREANKAMSNKEETRIQQIDRLAQDIRIIDGAHQMSTAELAEKLYDVGYRLLIKVDKTLVERPPAGMTR